MLIDSAYEQLLAAHAVSEPQAFEPLYRQYYGQIYNYVRFRVRDPHVTEDLVAHIFTRAFEKLDSYRAARAPFGAWLFGIARNCVAMHFRSQRRRRWLSLDFLLERASDEAPPEEVAGLNEQKRELLQALGRLSDRERDIIGLKFAARMTNRRIAELTGLSEEHVAVILFRAMRRLRGLLTQEIDNE